MEFWGVEVKSGETVTVDVNDEKFLHLTQAALGELKKKGSDPVNLFLTFGDQKLVLGTLSAEKFPQLTFDLVFEKTFLLSHNLKKGSVYFAGYTRLTDDGEEFDDFSNFSDEEEPLEVAVNGKSEAKVAKAKPAVEKEVAAKAKVEVESSEDDSEDDSDDSDEEMDDAEDSDDSGADSEDEEETPTPKKAVGNKKRQAASATKTPEQSKKAKVATPEKKDGKKGGHIATPHPAKKAASKTPNTDKSKSPKSGGEVSCKSCSRTFKSEQAMEAHSKSKHSGK